MEGPVIIPKDPSPRFMGLTQFAFFAVLQALVVLSVATLAVMVGVRLAENQKQLNFICATTQVLDELVVTTNASTKAALADGRYAQLVRQGFITQKELEQIRVQVVTFDLAHQELQNNGACRSSSFF